MRSAACSGKPARPHLTQGIAPGGGDNIERPSAPRIQTISLHFFHDNIDTDMSQSDASDQDEIPKETSTYLTESMAQKFCKTFAEALSSGLAYTRVFDMLKRQGVSETLVDRLQEAVFEKGDKLAEAFERLGMLDEDARALVLVAETQGTMPETFQRLANLYETRARRKKEMVQAMIMPLSIFLIGGVVFAYHMFIKGGAFNAVKAGAGPLDTLVQLGPVLKDAGIHCGIGVGVFAVVAMTFLYFPVDSKVREWANAIWLRVPVFGSPGRQFALSMFFRYFGQQLEGGMSVYEAMDLAGNASGHPTLKAELPELKKKIEEGANLKMTFMDSDAVPDDAVDYIDLGEESGELEHQLEFLADKYKEASDEEFENQKETITFMVLILTILVTFVGVFVGLGGYAGEEFRKAFN